MNRIEIATEEEREAFLKSQRKTLTLGYAKALWYATSGSVYMGTVTQREKRKRRAKGKVAKQSRKRNRH